MSGRRNTILGFNLTSFDDSFAQTVGRVDFAPNGFLRIVSKFFEVEDRLSDASSRAFQFRERSLIGRE